MIIRIIIAMVLAMVATTVVSFVAQLLGLRGEALNMLSFFVGVIFGALFMQRALTWY